MLARCDMKIADRKQLGNRVKALRLERGWSQVELAERTGISRPAVSAIEIQRLVPSVAVAMALARVFECRVEDLFHDSEAGAVENAWAWQPPFEPCRFWHARVGERTMLYPVESAAVDLPHDGVYRAGACEFR